VSSIALIQDGRAEVVEYRVETESKVVNRMLGDGLWFPKGSIVGALVRGDEVIVPRGGDTFLPGDRVIAFVLSEVIEELNDMFICLGDD
jgi:trk system potassium uptake protein TrkA